MGFNSFEFLPLITQLGQYLKSGMDTYAQVKSSGNSITPDALGAYLFQQMDGWDPELQGRKVLDSETKMAGARFLAGVVINMTG